MKNLFLTMSFFFILVGFFFFFVSFFFMSNFSSFFLEWNLIFKGFKISFPLFLDFKSCLFMGLVMLISGSIMFYSEFYMESELYKFRFFFLMKLFVISMVFLILCPNFICMLVGWDGLGLISFCLVIFYQNFKSLSSGMLTALTNRVGDVFILSSIVLFFFNSSWNYMNFLNFNNQSLLIYMFILAALTKSAQVPFSAWLPAAMAAPTPVSSLVHSSTLVTAGVYILIRFSFYFKYNHHMNFLILLGLLTMIMSGLSGIFEFDLKKIIALSTLSQLGFMMSTLSLNMPDLAFFHLLTHACFKALLFMCSGVFIHQFSENQDIRNLGFMNKNFSFSLCMFNVANLSLMGFPFLSGFFSKDLILEMMIMSKLNLLIFFMFLIGTFLTVFYSIRLMVFLTFKKSLYNNCLMQNSKNLKIEKSMTILFFFSILLGYLMSKLFFFPFNYIIVPFSMKILISCICLLSFFFSFKFSYYIFLLKNVKLMMFFGTMWFLAFLKTDFLKKKILNFGMILSNSLEIFTEHFFGQKNIIFLFVFSLSFSNMLKKLIFFTFFIFFFMIMWIFFMVF